MDFLRGVDRVLEHPRMTLPGIRLRPALGAVHDELGLAPELAKNGPGAGLLPNKNAAPEPAGGLNSIGEAGKLSPVRKHQQGRTRPRHAPALGKPERYPERVRPLIP